MHKIGPLSVYNNNLMPDIISYSLSGRPPVSLYSSYAPVTLYIHCEQKSKSADGKGKRCELAQELKER